MIESLLAGLFLLSALGLVGGVLYLFWKLRTAGQAPSPSSDGGHWGTLFPAVALVVLVAAAVALQLPRATEPRPSLVVKLTGFQFGWRFEYFESVSGKGSAEDSLRSLDVSTLDHLVLPRGTGTLVLATSSDVVHRLEIPSLQVRKDLIPGLVSSLPLNTPDTGEFVLLSDGLCGAALNLMIAKLTVLEPSSFEEWLDGKGARVAARSGAR